MAAPSSSGSQLWADLPPDVLREISGRLHHAADYVQFHAVCKPWRSSSHEPTTTRQKQSLLPWLLAPDKMNSVCSTFLEMRCVFSRTSYRARPPFSVLPRDWVASADGTAVWYFAAYPSPSLRDPLTGAVARLLPPFQHRNGPWWKVYSPNGIVYDDGAVILCTVSYSRNNTAMLRAALLRPGDAAWTVVERTFESPCYVDESCVVYHGGKIMIVVDGPVVSTPSTNDDVVAVLSRPSMPGELDQNFRVSYFLLESRGELLCVSVHADSDYPDEFGGGMASVPGLVRALSVSVHALEEEAPGQILWVRKDSGSLADRVLLLGRPNSFAIDASQLSGDAVSGGCAYFVYEDLDAMPNRPCYVFRYDLVHDKAKFLEQLPQGWSGDNVFTWLFPQPSIAPIQVITERLEGRKWWKKKKPHTALTPWSNIYVERPQPERYNPCFRVFVGNLPREVDSFQLRKFFSKHGKVSNAKVMCRWKKKKSKKIGLVTIAMVEEQADALAALNGLVFNGCILEVRLVRRRKEQRVPPAVSPPAISNQHTRGHLIYIGLLILLFVIMVLWISSEEPTRGSVPCYRLISQKYGPSDLHQKMHYGEFMAISEL